MPNTVNTVSESWRGERLSCPVNLGEPESKAWAKAQLLSEALIAALKRCATQKQMPPSRCGKRLKIFGGMTWTSIDGGDLLGLLVENFGCLEHPAVGWGCGRLEEGDGGA
jgi:hypothetical protein